MLTLLSPAKKLLPIETPYSKDTTEPLFPEATNALVAIMKALPAPSIARLMHLSKALADLNYQRYQHIEQTLGYPAVFLFQGDVYQTLHADAWDTATLDFAQSHLMILSGLYGVLRPLDLIKPHRLEMGTKLLNPLGNNLYDFWKQKVTQTLNEIVSTHSNPILINLASQEYFNVVDKSLLNVPVLTIHFQERIGQQLKVIGIHAKKARGAMAHYIQQHRIDTVKPIQQFDQLGYHYCNETSDAHNAYFIRCLEN